MTSRAAEATPLQTSCRKAPAKAAPKAGHGPVLAMFDGQEQAPLQQRLFDRLRGAILSGTLAPGDRLPSTRTLAHDLGLSRNTVVAAVERLAAEGYLEARVGSGTYVARVLPDELLTADAATAPAPQAARAAAPRPRPAAETPLPFRPGLAALDQFDLDSWRRILAKRWRQAQAPALERDTGLGWAPLRRALAVHLDGARGIRVDPGQIVIVPTRAAATELACALVAEPGATAWTEDPGCPNLKAQLACRAIRAVPVPVDAEGLDPVAGRALAPNARLAFVSPAWQFPLGGAMSLQRRLDLMAWARTSGAWIVEDDSDGGFRYTGKPLAALKGLDADGHVLHVGGFDRVLFPSLRVAYLVVPPEMAEDAAILRSRMDLHVPLMEQMALADFMNDGHLASHIRRARQTYQERQEALVDAAKRRWSGAIELVPSAAGLHALARLAPGLSDTALQAQAARHSVEVMALSPYHAAPGPATPQGLVLGFAAFGPALINRAAERLAVVLERMGA
ncbi:MAG TPA: PLP-dependent aminotransferase family protein [Azospirillaceae bacterium]|nr:PLP-dependent aminotransferase family protein [Azospirillaceae bacterium]